MLSACSIVGSGLGARRMSISIRVDVAPPALPTYEQPPIPGDGYLWVPDIGHGIRVKPIIIWTPATWVLAPEPGVFEPYPDIGRWGDGFYVFHEGLLGAACRLYWRYWTMFKVYNGRG